jgi:hypothetical protein
MTVLAVVFIVAFALLAGGIVFSKDHEINGWPAALVVLLLLVSGLALAIHAL